MTTQNYFEFKLEGVKELDRVLASLPKAAGKQQLKAFLRKAAKPVVKDARANAWKSDTGSYPYDPKSGKKSKIKGKPGDMARSIKARTMTRTRVPAAISIGPDQEHWYGLFQERGTAYKAAQPFLRPAWDAHKKSIAANLAKDLSYVLERMAQRLLKQAYAGKLSKAGRKALGL